MRRILILTGALPRLGLALAFAALLVPGALPGAGLAGEADVIAVSAIKEGAGVYRFDVTLRHADSGWEHYANRWDVLSPGGAVLGTRVLHHPHVNEQPFTRSLGGVRIAAGINQVIIRAHDKRHELGGQEFKVNLPE